MFSRSFVLLLLLLLPLSTWAAAQLPGIRLYERGEYAKASRALKEELNNPRRTEQQKALARVYLAASLLALEKEDDAYLQIEELVLLYPEQRVDPALFPPELVEMERKVRALVEQRQRKEAEAAERERQRQEAELAEQRRKEQEADRGKQDVELRDDSQGKAPADPAASLFRLRPEALGFSDFAGVISPPGKFSFGFGLGISAGMGMFDTSARALFGDRSLGVELDAGLLFGQGAFQPRVGLRGTFVQGFTGPNTLGGGASVGGRLALSPKLTALLDVSGQAFSVPEGSNYRAFVLMGSAGVGFNLL